MKKIVLYSPGLCSYNTGDKVISNSAKSELEYLLKDAFVTELPTHTPLSYYYARPLIKSDYKFVLGSNLLKATFWGFKRQWDVGIISSFYVGPCVLVGAGWWQYSNKPNLYTKLLYKNLLSKKYVHSVRDEYTLQNLQKLGFKNVLNTGCPSIWSLDEEHCFTISDKKADKVVFTITDYNQNPTKDVLFIELLIKNYSEVFFWPQGVNDMAYVSALGLLNKVKLVRPSLSAFDELLQMNDIDYVGTRLHAGIRALQNKRRALIISIDNRAEEKKRDFNLPVVARDAIEEIELGIRSQEKIMINLPKENIQKWKNQFR